MANLGAASIGGYMDFIQQMLGLRNQRLEEEKANAALQQEQMGQMLGSISSLGSSIGSGISQFQQNKTANQLMQEYYGGAGTSGGGTYGNVPQDASFAGAKLAAGGGTPFGTTTQPRQFTGGMNELKMRMAMNEDLSQADYRNAMIKRMEQSYEYKKDALAVKDATEAKKLISKELDQDRKNEEWFLKEDRVTNSAIDKAQTREQWQTAVDAKTSLYRAAQKRGMKDKEFDPTKIAPFMTQTEKDALADQQTAVSEARKKLEEAKKAPLGWADTLGLRSIAAAAVGMEPGPTYHEEGVTSSQQLYEEQMNKLKETPGASFYGERPVTKPQGELKEAGGIPLGTIKSFRNKATGKPESFKWNGTDWEPI